MPRMTLTQDEYLSEYGGRMPAGSAVDVPDDVAEKWEKLGIAAPSKKSDKSARELRMALLQEEMDRLAGEEEGGSYRSMMRRGPGAGEAPKLPRGRRGAAARADLEGAEVANEEEADEDDEDTADQKPSGKK